MAGFTIRLEYAAVFQRREGLVDASLLQAAIDEVRGEQTYNGQPFTVHGTATEADGQAQLRLVLAASIREANLDRSAWRLRELAEKLATAVSELAREQHAQIYHQETDRAPAILWRSVKTGRPQATILVPLLKDDHAVLVNDEAARRTVIASIYEVADFWSDEQEQLAALQVRLDGGRLVIVAPSLDAAVDLGSAYLSARRRRLKPWESLPPRPLWAIASAIIAVVSFGLSWAPLTWATLSTFAAVTVAIVAAAVALAPRFPAGRGVTAWGLAPILTLTAFAFCYGAIALSDPSALALAGQSLHFLREPFLLSLSLLTTVGMLDFHVAGWVRSLAYLEMLLVAGLAGGATIVAARRLSRRADAIVSELRREREG